ncbi:2-acyl-glycerophospho-ethanolamine acyltransferase, partial [Candidatus Magnetomorum sp. HK-1]
MAKQAIKSGDIVCIFPEGQLTRTGNILKFNQGIERIMKGLDAPIIPVHLDRIWGSIFSFERGRYFFKVPKIIPYPITISYGSPMPADSTAFSIRSKVLELGSESFRYRLGNETLQESFWREVRRHPKQFCMTDTSGKEVDYATAFIAALSISKSFKKLFKSDNRIGIMLPPSVGGALANIAVAILGKVAININYTSSKDAMKSLVDQSGIKCVITSKKFLEKVKIELPVNQI